MAFTPLNALNSFIAVARHRSFAAAARHLGVSTSALSQSVRQLEARLGVTLLTRTSRTVALTDAGQRLLENAGPAVDQALESLKTVSVRPGEVTGRVRLSCPGRRSRSSWLASCRGSSSDIRRWRSRSRSRTGS